MESQNAGPLAQLNVSEAAPLTCVVSGVTDGRLACLVLSSERPASRVRGLYPPPPPAAPHARAAPAVPLPARGRRLQLLAFTTDIGITDTPHTYNIHDTPRGGSCPPPQAVPRTPAHGPATRGTGVAASASMRLGTSVSTGDGRSASSACSAAPAAVASSPAAAAAAAASATAAQGAGGTGHGARGEASAAATGAVVVATATATATATASAAVGDG